MWVGVIIFFFLFGVASFFLFFFFMQPLWAVVYPLGLAHDAIKSFRNKLEAIFGL